MQHDRLTQRRRVLGLASLVVGCFLATGCRTRPDDSTATNTVVVQRYFAEWANGGNPAAADELIAPNLVLRNPPAETRGLEAYKHSMAGFHAVFPDLHFVTRDLVAQGDRVAVRWTLTGTQQAEFQSRPATGQKMAITGMSLFRLEAGRIQEIWVNMDRLGMQEQLAAPAAKP